MDPNQCGPSNAMKDFSRLTLEDRSRYQDRFVGGNGTNAQVRSYFSCDRQNTRMLTSSQQSFRTGMNNGNQANADFAGFQSGSSALSTAHQTNFPQLPSAYAPGFGQQFQPTPGVGGAQSAATFQDYRPAAQPSTQFDGYAAFNAARLAPQPATQASRFPASSAVNTTPGQMPNSMFGPTPSLMPSTYGAATPQAGFGPFAQTPFASHPQMAPNMFQLGK